MRTWTAELKDRAQNLSLRIVVDRADTTSGRPQPAQQPNAEAVSALVNLGYGRADAFAAVMAVAGSDDLNGPLHYVANATPYLFDEASLARAVERMRQLAR